MTSSNAPLLARARDLVAKLKLLPKGTELKWYIAHIRFPMFKNIERNARITFEFPVTALVGPNGCGKTSALHALYGAPKGKSTSDFWFATDLDPIKEGQGEPNRFIYGHYLAGHGIVETRKARVGKAKHRRIGYFEPTKATKGDGMDVTPFPSQTPITGQSKDRWNPVERPLTYMNFRSELSAFDKYLFWADPKPTKLYRTKHERLQLGAKRLNQVIKTGAGSALLRGRQTVEENRLLNPKELAAVCSILGREYTEARIVRHRYYGGDIGVSVQFRTAKASYSEAFAGSGELAVASLVVKMLDAPSNSLVLLDEPEVSLHPAAQERLCIFLLSEALRRKHQIIFTTHSEAMIRHLPEAAIKVFYESPDGKFSILDAAHPYAAFRRLGASVPNTIRILVEDQLAKRVIDVALLSLDPSEQSLFEVEYLPGGATSYLSHRVGTLMFEKHPTYVVLDGDQRPEAKYPDPKTIPESDNGKLADLIKQLTGVDPHLTPNGGNDTDTGVDRTLLRRQYLSFLYERVRFLPQQSPEAIVLGAIGEPTLGSAKLDKGRLCALAKALYGNDSAEAVERYAYAELAKHRHANADVGAVVKMLQDFLAHLSITE